MKYVPIAGTGGFRAAWVRETDPFGVMMAGQGFESARVNDRGYRWSGALDGVDGDNNEWEAFADALGIFLDRIDYEDRNLICHSHAGNIAIILAGRGYPIRTLTTVGTPIREGDLPCATAEKFIRFHQHIYSTKLDIWGWLGRAIGDHSLIANRAYSSNRVKNIPVHHIGHSKVLTDPTYIRLWIEEGWLDNIRAGGGYRRVV